ncbi:MAG: hypothetical protein H2057_06430 [Alphaproteobacteria bacterium]|nr:hypothetical protein [Alphaproteobacteria bacterium]
MGYRLIFFLIYFTSTSLCATNPYDVPLEQKERLQKGSVFKNESYILVEEMFANQVRRSHPLSTSLSLGTVEMLSPRAILHQSYYWYSPSNAAVQSFVVTPSQASNKELSSETLPQNIYAKIPVRLGNDQTLELLVFEEHDARKQKDYAVTVASALKLILASYIPKAHESGSLPHLKRVVIKDSNPLIAQKFLGKGDQEKILSKYYTSTTYNAITDTSSFWEIIYRVRDRLHHTL